MTFQLISNGIQLDTNDNINVSLNYMLDDVLDISKRNTSFSKTITLPGSPINNKYFKHIFDVNVDNINFNVNRKIPAVIRNGDAELMSGDLQLINIKINNEEISYEVVVAGLLKNIINEAADYTLRNLDFSFYDHYRTKDSIQKSWSYINNVADGSTIDYGVPGQGYVYPYIINGRSTNIDNTLYIYNMFPALYNKMVWDKMFEFLGMTYTSSFIESEYFSKLILPFVGDKLTKSAEQVESQAVRAGVNPVEPIGAPTFVPLTPKLARGSGWWYSGPDATPNYNLPLARQGGPSVINNGSDYTFTDIEDQLTVSGGYTCTNTGYYDINLDLKVFPEYSYVGGRPSFKFNSGDYEYNYKMVLVRLDGTVMTIDSSLTGNNGQYGTELFQPSDSDDHSSPSWIDYDTPIVFSMSGTEVYMEAGDKIRVSTGVNVPGAVDWNSSGGFLNSDDMRFRFIIEGTYDGGFSVFEIFPSNNETLGQELINMNSILPNTTLKDFFLDTIKMFNLIVVDNPDIANDLIIETRDDYYASKESKKDWTLKLDRDKGLKITPMSKLDAKEYLYTYKDDSDWLNKEYTDETNNIHGQYSLEVYNDFSQKTNKTEIGFSSTPSADKYIDGRIAPFFVEGTNIAEFKPKKVNRRILFYGGLIPSEDAIQFKNDEFDDTSQIYSYPYCGMWDHPTNPKWSLSFGKNTKEYFKSTKIPNSNLFEKFHKQTLNNITNINARLLEGYFHLTNKDIAEFDFRDTIEIDGSYWRVNKISDFNTTGESVTKVLLYKIIDKLGSSEYSLEVPTNTSSCPFDIVGVMTSKFKYYKSLSGSKITEDCCLSIGGNYVGGVCYIRDAGGTSGSGSGSGGLAGVSKGISKIEVVPTSEPSGPVSNSKDGNTINSLGVKVYGKGNYVPRGVKSTIIVGNNNSVEPFVKNSIIVGDGINASESDVTYIGGVEINGSTGNITVAGGTNPFITPIDITYAELVVLRDASGLSIGTVYNMTDKRIRLTALDVDKLSLEGSRIMTLPLNDLYTPHTQVIQAGITANFLGIYGQTIVQGSVPLSDYTFNTGQIYYAIWGGKLWLRDTFGVDGGTTVQDTIDGTGWTQVTTGNYVEDKTFFVNYDFDNEYVCLQTDWKGNIISDSIFIDPGPFPLDFNGCDVTDWNRVDVYNNTNYGIFNNHRIEGIIVNFGIYDNTNTGYIYDNVNGDGTLGSRISRNSNSGDIFWNSNSISGIIQDNSNNGWIANNSNDGQIFNNSNSGDILNNTNLGDISTNSNAGFITNNSNTGDININSNNGLISNNTNAGSIDTNSSNGFILNNSNNGLISNNTNAGFIFSNSNNGPISDNSNIGHIAYNSNAGFILNNSNTLHISTNMNNGNIANSTIVGTISDPIVNK